MLHSFFVLLLCVLSCYSYASPTILTHLSQFPLKEINSVGMICEKLAEIAYRNYHHFEDDITILTNITYTKPTAKKHRRSSNPLGELDVLILRDGVLVEVAEVKCYNKKNQSKAKKKGRKQLARFKAQCVQKQCDFWKGHERIKIGIPIDDDSINYQLVSYKGSSSAFKQFNQTYDDVLSILQKIRM